AIRGRVGAPAVEIRARESGALPAPRPHGSRGAAARRCAPAPPAAPVAGAEARKEDRMTVSLWRTDEALPPAFEARWNARLPRSPRAGFSLDAAFLSWSARHGEPGIAALVDEHGRRGALVLRETRDGFACGWPWRWQALVETEDARDPLGMSPADAAWLHEQALEIAGGRRLTCFLP